MRFRLWNNFVLPVAFGLVAWGFIAGMSYSNGSKDMLQRGSPGIGPIEAVDIEVAVAYIRGVRAKLFKSKHPVKDVSKYCGVTSRTVSNWQKRLGSVEPSDLYFNIDGLGPEEDPLKILKKAGFRYKRAGRSSVGRAEHSL